MRTFEPNMCTWRSRAPFLLSSQVVEAQFKEQFESVKMERFEGDQAEFWLMITRAFIDHADASGNLDR